MTSSQYMTGIICAIALALLASACATIVGHPTQTVPIASTSADANIVIVDEAGQEVFKGTAPASVTLPKSTGKYWGKKTYTVTISTAGYKDQVIHITSSPNGWYLVGNFVFGGLIGWFVVDPFNGNMYTLSPENINVATPSAATPNNATRDGSMAVVLYQDVPKDLRNKLVRIN